MRGERDVDLGRLRASARTGWWLIVLGAAVGAAAGFGLLSHRAPTRTASVKLFVGEARDQAGVPLVDTPTVLGLVAAYVESDAAIRSADAAAHLPPLFLRGRVTARPVVPVVLGRNGLASAILDIEVAGPSPRVARAANRLAALAVRKLVPYEATTAARLERSVSADTHELALLRRQLAATQSALGLVGRSRLAATDRALALGELGQTSQQLLQAQRLTQTSLDLSRQQLAAVENLDVPRTVVSASTARAGGPTRSGGLAVGAVIGAVLGLLAALLREPARRAVAAAAPRPEP